MGSDDVEHSILLYSVIVTIFSRIHLFLPKIQKSVRNSHQRLKFPNPFNIVWGRQRELPIPLDDFGLKTVVLACGLVFVTFYLLVDSVV